jgi:hypothetical protein
MKVSGLFPDLEFEDQVGTDGEPRLRIRSSETGLDIDCNCSNQVDDLGMQPHTARVIAVDRKVSPPSPGLAMERAYYPEQARMPGLSVDDSMPPNKDVHQTGGPDRCYTPRAAQWALHGPTASMVWTGVAKLRDWVRAQLSNRPICHGPPRDFRESLDLNPGTPNAWRSDTKTPAGWNAFDVAHAHWDYEAMFGLMGFRMGLACFALKWSWFITAHPPETHFWTNQERAVALALVNSIYGAELGIGRGDDDGLRVLFAGRLPKKALNDYATALCDRYPVLQATWQGDVDQRKLPDLGTALGGPATQLQGQYTPMNAQLVFAMAKAILSGLLRPEVEARLVEVLRQHVSFVFCGAGAPGKAELAWAFGTTQFTQDVAQQAIQLALDAGYPGPNDDPLEVDEHPDSATTESRWSVRKQPKLQDVEMTCAAFVAAESACAKHGLTIDDDSRRFIDDALAALPALESDLYGQSSKPYSRYLGVAYALRQLAAV